MMVVAGVLMCRVCVCGGGGLVYTELFSGNLCKLHGA